MSSVSPMGSVWKVPGQNVAARVIRVPVLSADNGPDGNEWVACRGLFSAANFP